MEKPNKKFERERERVIRVISTKLATTKRPMTLLAVKISPNQKGSFVPSFLFQAVTRLSGHLRG
jgi:hypothetical protein